MAVASRRATSSSSTSSGNRSATQTRAYPNSRSSASSSAPTRVPFRRTLRLVSSTTLCASSLPAISSRPTAFNSMSAPFYHSRNEKARRGDTPSSPWSVLQTRTAGPNLNLMPVLLLSHICGQAWNSAARYKAATTCVAQSRPQNRRRFESSGPHRRKSHHQTLPRKP